MCLETDQDCTCECLGNLTKEECCNTTEGQGRWVEGDGCEICETCPSYPYIFDCSLCYSTGNTECDLWPGSEVNFYRLYPQCNCDIESFNAEIELTVGGVGNAGWGCEGEDGVGCIGIDPFNLSWNREVAIDIQCNLYDIDNTGEYIIGSGGCNQNFYDNPLQHFGSAVHPENGQDFDAFTVQYFDDSECPVEVRVAVNHDYLLDETKFEVRFKYAWNAIWNCSFTVAKRPVSLGELHSTTIGEIVDSINSAGIGLFATPIASRDSLFGDMQGFGYPTTQPTTIRYKKPNRGKWRVAAAVSADPPTDCVSNSAAAGVFETSEWIGRELVTDTGESLCPTELDWIYINWAGDTSVTGTFNIT